MYYNIFKKIIITHQDKTKTGDDVMMMMMMMMAVKSEE